MRSDALAIVGLACQYADARSPSELWETVMAQRRAFRRIPATRLRLEDYSSRDPKAVDRTYIREAAVIEGYTFDRLHYRVAGSTFRSADLTHWLALDVAAEALRDAGFEEGEGLPGEATGVILGNTLTGEFSRANVMRLRWPYVRRVVEDALRRTGWAPEAVGPFLAGLEEQYKAPFPPVGEETLAGGLSNTIAGRICNHFDLKGGGFSVDGACASSLLAIIQACNALVAGDLDVALAGGVDLSLDPFELVGFAKTGALAPEEMRVYDARSSGFWPGEGCGFAVLMRHADAVAQGRRIHALIRGWGVSSDGQGGITRPEVEGQRLALRRAYHRAGFGIHTVAYFEGHGTGTAVGDATELESLSRSIREAAPPHTAPAVLGSVKANIGHTKAAAGIAGIIKATLALQAQALPPTPGIQHPHPTLTAPASVLRVLTDAEPWPAERPLRAGVSAMGFGGINTHVVLEGTAPMRRRGLAERERRLAASSQDAEVFLLGAFRREALEEEMRELRARALWFSRAQLADVAFELQRRLTGTRLRAAVVASTPAELTGRLDLLAQWLKEGVTTRLDMKAGVFLGGGARPPRVGYLFPGQGAPTRRDGGAWQRRFPSVRELHAAEPLPPGDDAVSTDVAQPAIVTAALAGLRVLMSVGLEASVAVGHSLGELVALHWAGAFDEARVLRLARVRGRVMAELGAPSGTMASISAPPASVESLLPGLPVAIAAYNSPRQTVVSGAQPAVAEVLVRARMRGLPAVQLKVSHAFHSPLMARAAVPLADHLARERLEPLARPISSTVSGALLRPNEELRTLLCQQLTQPVRFMEALAAAGPVDLWLEVGPGRVLSGLVADSSSVPVIPLDVGGESLRGLLQAAGAAFVLGMPLDTGALFSDRFTRSLALRQQPTFFENPCEQAPISITQPVTTEPAPRQESAEPSTHIAPPMPPPPAAQASALELVRCLVAARAELPESTIKDEHRLLGDLHLNSISVSQIAQEAARQLGLPPLSAPLEYAQARVATLAQALEELRATGATASHGASLPAGVDTWVRGFSVEWVEGPRPSSPASGSAEEWQLFAPEGYPLASALLSGLSVVGPGHGIVVYLPRERENSHAVLLLRAAHAALATGATRFLVMQHARGGSAFARTLHLEAPHLAIGVVEIPEALPDMLDQVVAEAASLTPGFSECRYTASGERQIPVLWPLPPASPGPLPLGPDDVLLVTGGGKGIAAECALDLVKATGARLGLLGRSRPEEDAELAANLSRIQAAGVRVRYVSADVTDSEALQHAVRELEAELGPITAALHGAGTNVPRLISQLDESALLATLAPKHDGARNLLAAVTPERLRLFIAFSSIIGRLGMAGEADYALANEWLTELTEHLHTRAPACRCMSLEWSIWSGVGMGERLGRVEALALQGITAIPPERGVAMLRELLGHPAPPVAIVVSGRMGERPALGAQPPPPLPFLRFLERPRVHYPGVELVVDAEVSGETDPALEDHIFSGERLLPAVLGMEAMAQAVVALTGTQARPTFEHVTFERPVVVPPGTRHTVRLAALVRAPGLVDVVLRCDQTSFQVDHFRATCRVGAAPPPRESAPLLPLKADAASHHLLEPQRDLYGCLFFHSGRFRRISRYLRLQATECVAELTPALGLPWFARFLPAQLVLGDPAARDAALHAIQACVPHALLIPSGVDAVRPGGEGEARYVLARERSRTERLFVYDVEIRAQDGGLLEHWEGLRLQVMEGAPLPEDWPPSLLAPYAERRMGELLRNAALQVSLEMGPIPDRRARSEHALRQLLGEEAQVSRRPDGKPMPEGLGASAAHAGELTLAVTGPGEVGCDLQAIEPRLPSVWRELLGPERMALAELVARECHEDAETAATRVWAALECMKKAGLPADTPLVLDAVAPEGWTLFCAGSRKLATLRTRVRGVGVPLVLAALPGGSHACI